MQPQSWIVRIAFTPLFLLSAVQHLKGAEPETPLPCPLWSVTIGRDAGPLQVADQNLFVGTTSTDETAAELHCYDRRSGKRQWIFRSPKRKEPWLDQPRHALRSRPVVQKNRIVFYTNRGTLVCLEVNSCDKNASTKAETPEKEPLWTLDLRESLQVFKRDAAEYGLPPINPLLDKNLVICATGNSSTLGLERFYEGERILPTPEAPACIAVDLAEGKLAWKNNEPSSQLVLGSHASPILISSPHQNSNLLVFLGGDGLLYGLSPQDGSTLWKSAKEHSLLSAQPPIDCGSHVIVVGRDPLSLPKTQETTKLWGFSKDSLLSPGDEKQPEWTCDSPHYTGALAEGLFHNGLLFVLCEDGKLLAVDPPSGKIVNHRFVADSGFSFSAIHQHNDTLLIAADDRLHLLTADQELNTQKIYVWEFSQEAQLLLDSQHLFVAGSGQLQCYSLDRLFTK